MHDKGDIYLEISEYVSHTYPSNYIAFYDVDLEDKFPIYVNHILYSNRVWMQTKDRVFYIKNRFESDRSKVDMKEFMWIKLRSVPL